jgi:hypothetical protein
LRSNAGNTRRAERIGYQSGNSQHRLFRQQRFVRFGHWKQFESWRVERTLLTRQQRLA